MSRRWCAACCALHAAGAHTRPQKVVGPSANVAPELLRGERALAASVAASLSDGGGMGRVTVVVEVPRRHALATRHERGPMFGVERLVSHVFARLEAGRQKLHSLRLDADRCEVAVICDPADVEVVATSWRLWDEDA